MKIFKKVLLAAMALGALLLAGCGRSDVTLTVNGDGSFHASVNYGIVKAGVASDEAMTQVKALITDDLNQAGIPYSESEDEERVTITVERDFADLSALTSPQSWQGINFVPTFSASEGDGIWVRYEDGKLRLSGTLDVNAFKAADIVNDDSDTFGGSLTVVLPSEAEEFSGGEKTDAGYVWSGGKDDSVEMSLTSAPDFGDLPQAREAEGSSSGGKTGAASTKDKGKAKDEKPAFSWLWAIVGVILAAAVIFIIVKKNGAVNVRKDAPEGEPKEDKPDEEAPEPKEENKE